MSPPLKTATARPRDPLIGLILIVAAALLLYQLDHRPFWQDEAETAGLARNTLKYGVPRAFDGVNLISQESGREFGPDHLWRWSPWLQIYLTAAAFGVAGETTWAGRLPYALLGLISIYLVYAVIRRLFNNLAWARLSAACLALCVPYLLFCRQCRYYSLGACLILISTWAFRSDWPRRWGPAALLTASLGLLFYTNYVLFLSFLGALAVSATLFYRRDLPFSRSLLVLVGVGVVILPGLSLFSLPRQVAMIHSYYVIDALEKYFIDLMQFLFPLPFVLTLGALLVGRWRQISPPAASEERFLAFLTVLVVVSLLALGFVPQCEHRYLVHLYPVAAMGLGWVLLQIWTFHRVSGVMAGCLLLLTNWLYLFPLEWLGINQRPLHNDETMLTYPNLPLKLYLTELVNGYPDVNHNLISFFQTRATPDETIMVTYGDLPLQFYTPNPVWGGLQGAVPPGSDTPDWIVPRFHTRWSRQHDLNPSEEYIRTTPRLQEDYDRLTLLHADETFGNRADPYQHRFVPEKICIAPLTIYRKKNRNVQP